MSLVSNQKMKLCLSMPWCNTNAKPLPLICIFQFKKGPFDVSFFDYFQVLWSSLCGSLFGHSGSHFVHNWSQNYEKERDCKRDSISNGTESLNTNKETIAISVPAKKSEIKNIQVFLEAILIWILRKQTKLPSWFSN